MKRSMDETLAALRQAIESPRPGIRFLIYPPEWEAPMQGRLISLAEADKQVELVDLGSKFVDYIDGRAGAEEALAAEEALGADILLGDLSTVAARVVVDTLTQALEQGATCRLLYNAGSLASFASFSSITNGPDLGGIAPAILAFPGDGDDHSLSLLNLRTDTDYRIPRI
jgi:hypothetical protein